MKCIVTIFQCKRVVLPYIFMKYCYPRMKEIFPGEMKAYIIQHTGKVLNSNFATAKICGDRIDLVKRWTEEGKYNGALIIRHNEQFSPYPALSSYRKGVEIALEENADFHLWIEDDALVLDEGCDRWQSLMEEKDVGMYRKRCPHILSAFLLTKPEFDTRILDLMKDKSIWKTNLGKMSKEGFWSPGEGEIEYFLTKSFRSRADLNTEYAARIHGDMHDKLLMDMVKRIAPEEAELLKIDFEGLDIDQ